MLQDVHPSYEGFGRSENRLNENSDLVRGWKKSLRRSPVISISSDRSVRLAVGINGKLWRLVKSWYSTSSGRERINHHISDKFTISRGVKQGSVLPPTLFLIVMDVLLKRMRESNCGLSITWELLFMCTTYVQPLPLWSPLPHKQISSRISL